MLSPGVMEGAAVRRIQPLPHIYGRGGFSLDLPKQHEASASAVQNDSEATRGINKSPDMLARELERFAQKQEATAPERAYLAAGRQSARLQQDPAAFAAFPGATQLAAAQENAPTANSQPLPDVRPESPGSWRDPVSTPEHTSKAGQNTGGMESRSPERTFLGGTAGATDRSPDQSGSEPRKASSEKTDEAGGAFHDAEQLTEEETQEVEELKARDREVRTHEQAHISAGAGLVSGGATYQTTRGPDGNTYAVGGEVQIDTSEEDTPDATIAKAQKIKSAALAPAEPSAQDRQVAAQAAQMETAARQEKNAASEDDSTASSKGEESAADAIREGETFSPTSKPYENELNKSYRAGKAYRRAASLQFSYTPADSGLSVNI